MIILSSLEKDQTAIVHSLAGGQRFVSRASAMGFIPGTPVTMVQNIGKGPVIVYLRDTQVALGHLEATRIQVERS